MKRSGSGRVARKIGAYDEDTAESTDTSNNGAQKEAPTVVKRPTFAKTKKRSSVRISFGPGDAEGNDGAESDSAAVVTPKKTNLSRLAMEQSAIRKARSPLVSELPRPRSESPEEERPTYSKDYIAELRNSTPTTPKDLIKVPDDELKALDITSKFGPSATLSAQLSSAIPTAAEIQEKKARRKRLAQEQNAYDENEDQPWASDDDDEFRTSRNEISLRPKEKYAETRLVREDEEMAEGFEDYVEDERIALGRKAERAAEKQRRAEMADLINTAEGGSDDDGSDDSEEERNAAYEAAQTRAGTGSNLKQTDDGDRTPPKITPLPDLGSILESLHRDVQDKQIRREMIKQKLEELEEEKIRIAVRQKFLQESLRKTGEQYEQQRHEAGMAALPANGLEGDKFIVNRGLDSMGTTPVKSRSAEDSADSDEEFEE